MKFESPWEKTLENEINRIEQLFITKNQFEILISKLLKHPQSPLAGIQYSIECPAPFENCEFGTPSGGEPDSTSYSPDDNRETTLRVKYWRKSRISLPKNIDTNLYQLFDNFWKSFLRTESAGIPDIKRDARAPAYAQNTIEYCYDHEKTCSLLFWALRNNLWVRK